MSNKLKAIIVSAMLTLSLSVVSCETANNLPRQNTTNNQRQTPNVKTDRNNKIANQTIESPKESNVVQESAQNNQPDNNVPNTNGQPTKEPPVEENIPIADNTTPQINDTTPGNNADNANLIENNPTIEQRVPITNNPQTIDNNTGVINNPAEGTTEGTTEHQYMSQVEQMIFRRVNEERAKAGRAALSYNTTMEKYARIKSKDMGDRGYFSHNDPEGKLITALMRTDGVSYQSWGENIAYIGGVSDPTALANQFMTNWMNSQGHRENILSNNFTSIGAGVYKIGNKVYATQQFHR